MAKTTWMGFVVVLLLSNAAQGEDCSQAKVKLCGTPANLEEIRLSSKFKWLADLLGSEIALSVLSEIEGGADIFDVLVSNIKDPFLRQRAFEYLAILQK